MTRFISFASLLAVIVVLVILFYRVIASFLIPLFLAAILVVIFAPVHAQILEWCRQRKKLAAWLTTITIMVVVLVPMLLLLLMAAAEGRELIRQFNAAETIAQIERVRESLGLDLPASDSFATIQETFSEIQNASSVDVNRRREMLKQHREALEKIRAAAERIAVVFGMPLADRPIDEQDLLEESKHLSWLRFQYELQQLQALRDRAAESIDLDEGSEIFFQYLRQISITHQAYSEFKTELLGGKIRRWLKEQANPTADDIDQWLQPAITWVRDHLFTLGASTTAYIGKFLLGLAIMVFALYFFLKDGPGMLNTLKYLSPIDDAHEQELIDEFSRVTRAVVLATLLSAAVQAVLAGVGFYFAGLNAVFLLTLLTACAAIIPFIGAASVWIPCCLYLLLFENNTSAAIGLAIYGSVVVSMADNIVKPLVLHGQSNMHPLIALLSIIGGISALGPIGLLIGPMIVAFLQTLLGILHRELLQMDSSQSGSGLAAIGLKLSGAPPDEKDVGQNGGDTAESKREGESPTRSAGKRRRRRRNRRRGSKARQAAADSENQRGGGRADEASREHRAAGKPSSAKGPVENKPQGRNRSSGLDQNRPVQKPKRPERPDQ